MKPKEQTRTAIIPNPTQQKEAFIERLLKSASGTFDMFTIYIGDRLGYRYPVEVRQSCWISKH
jgi:hypothetical protein